MSELTLENIDSIRVERTDGSVAVRVGFLVTLYFANPGKSEVRARMGRAVDSFLQPMASQIKWLRPVKANRSQPVRGMPPASHEQEFAERNGKLELEFAAHDAERERDAPLLCASVFAPSDAPFPQLGYVSLSLGVGALARLPGGAIRDFMQQVCETVRPFHGYAGLGILRNPNPYAAREAEAEALSLAQRFAGLELDAPVSHALYLGNGLKGVNWMTVVSDELAAKAGGTEALVHKASAVGVTALRYSDGAIYVAGDVPDFGDLKGAGVQPAYRAASRLLKPLRASLPSVLMNNRVHDVDPKTFTQQWQARFD